jgi:hypothetical protein
MGPESLFREAGYEATEGSGPNPVYRKELGSTARP